MLSLLGSPLGGFVWIASTGFPIFIFPEPFARHTHPRLVSDTHYLLAAPMLIDMNGPDIQSVHEVKVLILAHTPDAELCVVIADQLRLSPKRRSELLRSTPADDNAQHLVLDTGTQYQHVTLPVVEV